MCDCQCYIFHILQFDLGFYMCSIPLFNMLTFLFLIKHMEPSIINDSMSAKMNYTPFVTSGSISIDELSPPINVKHVRALFLSNNCSLLYCYRTIRSLCYQYSNRAVGK